MKSLDAIKQEIFDLSPEAIVIFDEKASAVDANKKALAWTGYKLSDLKGKKVWELPFVKYSKDNQKLVKEQFAKRIKGENISPYDFEAKTKNGEFIYGRISGRVVREGKNISAVVIMVSDVTEIHGAKERFKLKLDAMLEGVQIIDRDWRYVYLNDAVVLQSRKSKKDLLGKTMMEAYPGIEKTPLFKTLKECMTKRISKNFENLFKFPDGSDGWFELRIQPVEEGIFVLSLDITNRKLNEIQISSLMSNLPGMVYRCKNDKNWTMEFVSEGVLALTGYKPDEIIDNRKVSYADLIHVEDQDKVWDSVQKAVSLDKPYKIVYRIQAKDDGIRWVWEQGRKVGQNDEARLEGFVTDITERVEKEHELARLNEMLVGREVRMAELKRKISDLERNKL